jgi:nucleoid DNA-binding protein
MAKILEAVRDFGPKVKANPTVQLPQLAAWIAMRTSVNKGEVAMILQELNEAVYYFNCQGTPVKLDGIGTFKPSVNRSGEYSINMLPDRTLAKSLNNAAAFTGTVNNKSNIGLTNEAYKTLWDAAHPENPLEV